MKEEQMSVARQHSTWKLQSIMDTEVFIFLISVTITWKNVNTSIFITICATNDNI